jgi:hypothetical protein
MANTNVETGVLRALKAYKIEKGLSDAAATAWAAANLNAGVARFQAVLALPRYRREGGSEAAFVDLKAWAQTQS